jgi:hypothetical protein
LASGLPAAALTAFEQRDDDGDRNWAKVLAYFALGRKANPMALADLKSHLARTTAYDVAEIHAYRGEIDETFEWLDKAYRKHDRDLDVVKTDWPTTGLRLDPRYKPFLRKMMLPE